MKTTTTTAKTEAPQPLTFGGLPVLELNDENTNISPAIFFDEDTIYLPKVLGGGDWPRGEEPMTPDLDGIEDDVTASVVAFWVSEALAGDTELAGRSADWIWREAEYHACDLLAEARSEARWAPRW